MSTELSLKIQEVTLMQKRDSDAHSRDLGVQSMLCEGIPWTHREREDWQGLTLKEYDKEGRFLTRVLTYSIWVQPLRAGPGHVHLLLLDKLLVRDHAGRRTDW